jgi:hypothetical protein
VRENRPCGSEGGEVVSLPYPIFTQDVKLESATDAQLTTDATGGLPSMALDYGGPCRRVFHQPAFVSRSPRPRC